MRELQPGEYVRRQRNHCVEEALHTMRLVQESLLYDLSVGHDAIKAALQNDSVAAYRCCNAAYFLAKRASVAESSALRMLALTAKAVLCVNPCRTGVYVKEAVVIAYILRRYVNNVKNRTRADGNIAAWEDLMVTDRQACALSNGSSILGTDCIYQGA
jgi:hypothetical protein